MNTHNLSVGFVDSLFCGRVLSVAAVLVSGCDSTTAPEPAATDAPAIDAPRESPVAIDPGPSDSYPEHAPLVAFAWSDSISDAGVETNGSLSFTITNVSLHALEVGLVARADAGSLKSVSVEWPMFVLEPAQETEAALEITGLGLDLEEQKFSGAVDVLAVLTGAESGRQLAELPTMYFHPSAADQFVVYNRAVRDSHFGHGDFLGTHVADTAEAPDNEERHRVDRIIDASEANAVPVEVGGDAND